MRYIKDFDSTSKLTTEASTTFGLTRSTSRVTRDAPCVGMFLAKMKPIVYYTTWIVLDCLPHKLWRNHSCRGLNDVRHLILGILGIRHIGTGLGKEGVAST